MIVWLMWLICGIVVAVSCQSRSSWAPGLCRAKLTVLCLQVIYHFGPAIHFFCLSLPSYLLLLIDPALLQAYSFIKDPTEAIRAMYGLPHSR